MVSLRLVKPDWSEKRYRYSISTGSSSKAYILKLIGFEHHPSFIPTFKDVYRICERFYTLYFLLLADMTMKTRVPNIQIINEMSKLSTSQDKIHIMNDQRGF